MPNSGVLKKKKLNALEKAARDLHDKSEEKLFQIIHSICQLHLKKLEARQIAGRQIHNRVRWKQFDDLISKEFFQAIRERLPTVLSELMNEQGEVVSDPQGIADLCKQYYQTLYSTELDSLEVTATQDSLLQLVPTHISKSMKVN